MRVKLTDICEFQGGSQPPKSEWNDIKLENYVRMLQIRDFTQGKQKYIQYVKDNKKLKKCNDSDILIGRYGASIGKILTGLEGAYNVALMKITPNDELNKNYLYQFLNSSSFQNTILSIGSRAAQAGFNKDDLSNIKIPLPPLTQQKTIAKTLDKAKELIELRKASIKKLDELSKSVFIDMFGDPVENPMGWEVVKLASVIKIDAPMVQPNTPEYENLYLIGSDRISKNTGKILLAKTAKEDNVISKKFLFDDRYVLYSKIRPYLNKVAIANFRGLCSADMYPLRPIEDKMNKEFLWQLLLAKHFLKYTETLPDRASIPKLNRKELLDYTFPLPPLNLQTKFAKTIQKIESQKALYEKELVKLEENFEALLAKSFG